MIFSLFSVAALHKAISSMKDAGISSSTQQPFSQQKTGQHSQNLHSFVSVVSVLSGGDPTSLLLCYLQKTEEGRKVLQSLTSLLWQPLDATMDAIQQQMSSDSENKRKRKRWLSLVSDFDSETLRKRFKMSFSDKQLKAAKK